MNLFRKEKKIIYKSVKIDRKFNKNKVFDDGLFSYRFSCVKPRFEHYGSFLLKYPMNNHTAASWIDECCDKFNINPKLILCILEKNYQLVTKKESTSKEIMDKAMNMWVSNIGVLPKYAGFDKQIYHAAEQYRKWYELFSLKNKGKVNCIDDDNVVPENAFTYALYMCDPYVGVKDLYRVKTMKDIDNKFTGTEKVLQYKAPFGAYATWNIWEWWSK